MCYAIPGKVIEIKDKSVIVEYFGEKRKALNEFVDLKIGDYIYAQGGYVISRVPEKEALETLEAWKDLFFELKKIDLKISERRFAEEGFSKEFIDLLNRAVGSDATTTSPAVNGQTGAPNLSRADLLYILNAQKPKELDAIYRAANFVRQKHLGNACCVHGIIEFSNYCINNCWYCGIRNDNQSIKRYRMEIDEIVEAMDMAVNKYGFKAMVLQSGEDPWYADEKLVELVKKIKEKCAVLLFISIGERSPETYTRLFEAGARGVLLRFETSNAALYEKLRPGKKLADRLAIIEHCYKLGYLILTGSIIGLPNQTADDLINDIELAKKLHAEMYTFGPLIPHHATPLKNTAFGNLDLSLKVIAATRFIDPNAKIVVTTALETLNPKEGQQQGLLAGANSLMINCTPKKYQPHYEIYPDKAGIKDPLEEKIEDTLALLKSLGRAPTDLGIT
ncbi:MAG: [FeFe] hydrogenase H-cluster radical SAM maturase HydE [Candidatus Margulisiibacteriota bacterium]